MRDMSLLEQKKLQWAKEKEELSKLNDFFSATTTTRQFERTSIRTYYSNVDMSSSTNSSIKSSTMPRRANYYQESYKGKNNKDSRHGSCRDYGTDSTYDNDVQYHPTNGNDINQGANRAPMLPPIGRNSRQTQMPAQVRQSQFVHQNTDEETSGYLSDRISPLMWANQMQHQPQYQPQHSHQQNFPKDYSNYIYPSSGDEGLAHELDAMKIEERRRVPKKVPTAREIDDNGHETDFSMPKTPSSLCSDNRDFSRLSSCPPSRKDKEERAKWGDRNNHFYDIPSKESSIKSDGPCWLERGFADSGDESVSQNAPIDPNVLAERTTKRIKAIELQNAIKAQVEERERLRKLELEKSLMEERRLEESLRQQRESNEQRFEEDQRITREKLEREQRKQEMMRAAIEKARQEAEMERAKKKRASHTTSECESSMSNGDVDEQYSNTPVEDPIVNRTEVSKTPIPPKIEENEDDEKILIGTPIRMKKKTLNRSYKIPVSAKKDSSVQSDKEATSTTTPEAGVATNVDGIALVLQTLPPIMPILSNDIINLNQNINNLNTSNIQLAVMLAHQMQQLNNIAQTQTQTQNQNQAPDSLNNKMNGKDTNDSDEKQMISCQNENDRDLISNEVCKCTGTDASKPEKIIPVEDKTQRKDAATVTDDEIVLEMQSKELNIDKSEHSQVSDASTQTDRKLEYCFQCRYHHCHHHHVIVKDSTSNCTEDMKTIAVNRGHSKIKCTDKECASASNSNRINCTESKEPMKLEDRPKWGVNRPLQQYVKASERDPFYLRNKRKRHQKRQFSEEQNRCCDEDGPKEDSNQGSRSTSPSPSIITNSTVTLSSPVLKNRKRSICTEILPITTDSNGRVYLNFNGASLHVTEDEQRPSSKQRPLKSRIINRNQTANDIRNTEEENILN